MMAMRFGACAVAALMAGTVSAQAQEAPSNAELFRMLKEQQKLISQLRQELKEARVQRQAPSRDTARKPVPAEAPPATAIAVPRSAEPASAHVSTIERVAKPGWSASAAYLALKPGAGDTGYALNAPASGAMPSGTRVNNDFEHGDAYRLGLAYEFQSGAGLRATYTHLNHKATDAISGNFLWATKGHADTMANFENFSGTAASRLDLSYSRFDLLASLPVQLASARFNFLYGIEYANIDLSERYRFERVGVRSDVAETSDLKGIGPQIGVSVDYDVFRGDGALPGTLSLNVMSTASLLMARAAVSQNVALMSSTFVDVSDEKTDYIVPAFHLRAGLVYNFPVRGYEATLGLGYEFSSYIGAVNRGLYGDDVADGLSNTKRENFDLSGPYGDFKLKF